MPEFFCLVATFEEQKKTTEEKKSNWKKNLNFFYLNFLCTT